MDANAAHDIRLRATAEARDTVRLDLNTPTQSACKPFVRHPPAHTREHFRDVRGPFTIHRLFTVAWLVGHGVALFYLQNWMDSDTNARNYSYIGLVWLISLPSVILAVVGSLLFYHDTTLDKVRPTRHNVVFRIISRGINGDCLRETIEETRKAMMADSLFGYLIEVVTDGGVFEAPNEKDVIHLKVPRNYETPNGTKYKARSMHYAALNSSVPDNTWIVHLDEETRPLSSGIKGIARFIAETEASGKINVVGQGGMLYHRSWEKFPFLTLADMIRTGEDLGNYHLQHRLGFTMFGFHGAFIVCRADVEAALGFDIGKHGSITEDAWWILLAMQEGYRTRWIDGWLDEQSCESMSDYLKQRKRWSLGRLKVLVHSPAKMIYRLPFNLSAIWVYVNIFLLPFTLIFAPRLGPNSYPVPTFVRILTNFVASAMPLVYLNGLRANMREHGTKWSHCVLWGVLCLVALPFLSILEGVGAIAGLIAHLQDCEEGFHVVEKSATSAIAGLASDATLAAKSLRKRHTRFASWIWRRFLGAFINPKEQALHDFDNDKLQI